MRPRKPHWITGLGCLTGAGEGRLATLNTFFSDSPSPFQDEKESRFIKLRSNWRWQERFPDCDYRPNLFALLATYDALDSAGLNKEYLSGKRVGFCLGSTIGGTNYNKAWNQEYFKDSLPPSTPLLRCLTTNTAQFLKRHFASSGPCLLLNNACVSGADAVGVAAQWLDADLCDFVICGGTEIVTDKMYYGFRSLQLCSPLPCKPFDKDRQGLTLGEGAGILILEKENSTRKPLARFLGYGMGSDALHPTSPDPEARGLQLAARGALAQANLPPTQIAFVNAHATATLHNDAAEGKWIKAHVPQARVVATKGYTGHTLGAAGAVEAVFTALSLMTGKLPISRGFQNIDPAIELEPTRSIEHGNYAHAISCSLGFGGINSVLCLGKAP